MAGLKTSNVVWTTPVSLGATCYVVASDAKAEIKAWAEIAQTGGQPVWVCDGTADDVEIQAAISALGGNGNGVIELSEGTFNIAAALIPNGTNRFIIRGKGGQYSSLPSSFGTKLFLVANTNVNMFDFSGLSAFCEGFGFENLYLDGNGANQTNPGNDLTGNGFYLKYASTAWMRNVMVANFIRNGVYFVSLAQAWNILNLYVYGCRRGVVLEGQSHSNMFSGLHVEGSTTDGITLSGNVLWNKFSNSWALANNQHGIVIAGTTPRFNQFIGFDSVNNLGKGVVLSSGQYNYFVGVVKNNRQTGLEVVGADHNIFIVTAWDNSDTQANLYDGIATGGAGADYNEFIGCISVSPGSLHRYAINIGSGAIGNRIIGGSALNGQTANVLEGGTSTKVWNVEGYVTENSSTATVANAATTVVVSHGLATTPTRVLISLTNNPTNDPQVCWVSTLTATQFTINTKVDPGATGAIFDWRAQVGEG